MKTCKLLSIAVLAMAMSLVSCSGDDGEQGPQGVPGKDGTNGTNGVDGTDGTNGTNGVDGQDGEDKPNVSFYFQDGFKGYEGTQDVEISDLWGDFNNEKLNISYTDVEGAERFSLIRFDGIPDIINNELLEAGESCVDGYNVNQAILYLYCDQTYSDIENSTLYVRFGFLSGQDPLFNEESASWEMANALDPWFVPGAKSQDFLGPFPGTDNYSFKVSGVPAGTTTAESKIGWMAFQLPRSLVKDWVCDPDNIRNKGMRIGLSGNAVFPRMRFMSSDELQSDLRPLLVVETEKIDTQSGKGSFSNTKTKDWESMSYEEKMAPLYQYLEMKKTN